MSIRVRRPMRELSCELTSSAVAGLKPGRRPYIVWDSDILVFGVVIRRTGRRAYFVRLPDGSDHMLGPSGKEITAEQARKRALVVLELISQGVHPRHAPWLAPAS